MQTEVKPSRRTDVIVDLLLVIILLVGAYFRFIGIDWGEYTYLHPDERFLIWVGADINPMKEVVDPKTGQTKEAWMSWSDYFDTTHSTMNPANVGHTYYVYGTLPMFITRIAVQLYYGHSGFNEMTNIGRDLSAIFDLLTVFLVFLTAKRLYDKRVGLLAAAFTALAVLQIQQSHFFTMDTFYTFFTLLALYFAVLILTGKRDWGWLGNDQPVAGEEQPVSEAEPAVDGQPRSSFGSLLRDFFKNPLLLPCLAFGLALGCTVASKINAAPVAFALPGAVILRTMSMPSRDRFRRFWEAMPYMILAAAISLVVFRIAQPYTFTGPGFFGVKLNPQWLQTMKELAAGSSGQIDYPFALQWARRTVTFAWQNMVLWGMGLPLGLLAWAGFLWMGWRIIRGEMLRHTLLWLWTLAYFVWQSTVFNPSMRYQLLIYPTLFIFAAWLVFRIYDWRKNRERRPVNIDPEPAVIKPRRNWGKIAAAVIGGGVLVLTLAWAFAFSRIYARPITRVAATRWIYQNIPGPINLHIQTNQGMYNQPLNLWSAQYTSGYQITPQAPYVGSFIADVDGNLTAFQFGSLQQNSGNPITLHLSISDQPNGTPVVQGDMTGIFLPNNQTYQLQLDSPLQVSFQKRYYFTLSTGGNQTIVLVNGPIYAQFQTASGQVNQQLPYPIRSITTNDPYIMNFTPHENGTVSEIELGNVTEQTGAGTQTLLVSISEISSSSSTTTGLLQADLSPKANLDQQNYVIKLDHPIQMDTTKAYSLQIALQSTGSVTIRGAGLVNESDFDDALPLRLDGYDAIYPQGLNFQIYWQDNPEKIDRMVNMMDQGEYLAITSNRQWGSVTRIPERYPLMTKYYQELIGCPDGVDILHCYQVAKPGMYQGKLGYDLVQIFQSDPSIGPIDINDQSAEEVFTIYDHPKVLIFKKSTNFNAQQVRSIFESVDLSHEVNWLPIQFPMHPATLMLSPERLQQQQSNGTWSQLFNPAAWQNSLQILGVILWYVTLLLIGLMFYPLIRLALPGLPDRGYPLARTGGLLTLSYLYWIAGSFKIEATRLSITAFALLILLVGGIMAYWQRDELRQEWRQNKRYFLMIEGLALAFFLFDLFVRYGNPDLWHPYKGGEKPMDFAFLNAVIKSSSFPPYDPWFAGGYMNYYYYGFVLFGTLIKWLGIVPSFSYNLVLPSVFMLIALGAFSGGWNIFTAWKTHVSQRTETKAEKRPTPVLEQPVAEQQLETDQKQASPPGIPLTGAIFQDQTNEDFQPSSYPWQSLGHSLHPFLIGLAGALGMVVLGNLGTLRMIYQGYEKLAAPGGNIDVPVSIFTRLVWMVQGAGQALSGKPLPYGISDWYWIPSRVMPPNDFAITEFPYFTVLYGDPHAHLFAMSIALLALAWAISTVLGRARYHGPVGVIASFLLGGLAIGALYPTNLSDIYTYLPLGMVALGYSLWRYADVSRITIFPRATETGKRVILIILGVAALVFLTIILWRPYEWWYGQAYNSVQIWNGVRTPIYAYLTHWGLFLFVIVTWMIWETRDWMAKTPLSSLRKLEPYRGYILAGILTLLVGMLAVQYWIMHQPRAEWNWYGVSIIWLVLPLAVWAGLLILRPGQSDAKRLVLFLIGTALLITLVVDFVEVRGDINRMNTVFKFYLQAWMLLAVASAATLGFLISSFTEWSPNWKLVWQVPFVILVASASLFTLLATSAKIKDRMTVTAPHTLDGMLYMKYSTYPEGNTQMDLSQDYDAIRWVQQNVQGSPVIVEAASDLLYQWYSRFSIYTGLPDVVGWQWHEQQQRALFSGDWVSGRILDVSNFYLTTDPNQARDFLQKYNVKYIIVGQLERLHYAGPGIDKFPALNGQLWKEVYRDKDTVIYQVIS